MLNKSGKVVRWVYVSKCDFDILPHSKTQQEAVQAGKGRLQELRPGQVDRRRAEGPKGDGDHRIRGAACRMLCAPYTYSRFRP